MRNAALFFCLVSTFLLSAQSKYTVSGYIKDSKTGEELIGATVRINELAGTGVSTNSYGFYSITIPEGEYTLTAQFIGYDPKVTKISLKQSTKMDFLLTEHSKDLNEVVVTGERNDHNVSSTQMGVEKLNIEEIKAIPVLFGEQDVVKTLQLLPGVMNVGEGSTGFYVRGGGADQNLILLDEATVYNASHLLGFFSVFNSDAIKDVTLYKGNQPSEFGGRLSSVLDVKMKDGNDQNYILSGGIGLIASRLNFEGPIKKGKGSFLISARRTYADAFLKLSRDSMLNQAKLYFYDINVKANYILGDRDRVYLSGYFGKDVLGFGDTFGINWGNATGTVRWNHLFSDKLFSNTCLVFSNYDYDINISFGLDNFDIISRIQDYSLKQDYQYYINTKNKLKFGFISTYHQIIPGVLTSATDGAISDRDLPNKYALENAVYISHEVTPNEKFSFEYGLRLSSFTLFGPGEFYTYNTSGAKIDSANYSSGQAVQTYVNPEPRVDAKYILTPTSSIKASYGRNAQYLHLLSNSTSGNPTDLWIPSSNNVKPGLCDQFSLGYFRNFKDNSYEFSVETYYKDMQNMVDYRNYAQLTLNSYVESQLEYGIGRAYGIEFTLKKKIGRFTGWIGYTLSKTELQINGINNGSWYPATQDRPNDLSVVGIYTLSKKWTVSSTFVYYTGNAVTFPTGKYEYAGNIVEVYSERNESRMPDYIRLDIGFTMQGKKTEKYETSWNFSCYNVLGRENAYTITFPVNPNNVNETEALQTSLFRWVPSVTWNFKFTK